MLETMDEFELIQLAQEGDQEAFCLLAKRYRDSLVRVAYGYLHDRDEALDATQEVLLRAYRKLNLFKNESSLYTWLYRITANHCKDRIRSSARKPTISVEDLGSEGQSFDWPDDQNNPGQDAVEKERDSTVLAAIETLPEKLKSTLLLRELAGLSYKEIAESLQCQEGTVMSRLFHARKLLAEKLEPLAEELL